MFEQVAFPSQGAVLLGRLYLPQNRSMPFPVVVMAHGFSATISMVADRYAEVFYEAGFAVLLYDHRCFGASGGEPRQEINRWIQARGYMDAINYVTSRPELDASRIAIWGDSYSGNEAIVVGAIDKRAKVVVVQVPACGAEPPPEDSDGKLFAEIQQMLLHGDLTSLTDYHSEILPVVSFDQMGTPSHLKPLSAFRWFIEYGGRFGMGWENMARVVSSPSLPAWHSALCSPYLDAALLMMVAPGDEMRGANVDVAKLTYDRVPAPKQLIEIEGGHFGLLYYPSSLFTQASRAQRDFLIDHL